METVVRTLRPKVCGRRIVAVHLVGQRLRRPWRRAWAKLICGRRVRGLRRRGKWIVFELELGAALVVHLGMTGRLQVLPRNEPPARHTHLVFSLDPGEDELRFRDVRRFGSVEVLAAGELDSFFAVQRLGPEPFVLTPGELYDKLRSTGRSLKAVLLDQRVVAGVGNIYADEALFEARLDPRQLGRRTTAEETERLRRAIVKVLSVAIDKNGSTIQDFLYGDDEAGGYQNEFRVYQRTGQPCSRCRKPIARIRLAGRSTHYCPRCQRR